MFFRNRKTSETAGEQRRYNAHDQFAGRNALGGNVALATEFTGGPGSVSDLRHSIPKEATLRKGQAKTAEAGPIVQYADNEGNNVSLTAVVLAADSAVGIIKHGRRGKTPLVRFVELAYGENGTPSGRSFSSREIATVDPDVITQPRPNGTAESAALTSFGREDGESQYNIGKASRLSASHFSADVNPDGVVTVIDHSTNGTTLITGQLEGVGTNPLLLSFAQRIADPANRSEWASIGASHEPVINYF